MTWKLSERSAHVVMFNAGLTLITCLYRCQDRAILMIRHRFRGDGDDEPLKLNFKEVDYEEDEDLVSGKQKVISLCDWKLGERFKFVLLM